MRDQYLKVEVLINAPIQTVWNCWTLPEHIVNWNFASNDWKCPTAINEVKPGGTLNWRMEAKDGSMGFDFEGTYKEVRTQAYLSYVIEDGREVVIEFKELDGQVILTEAFEPEGTHTDEMQRAGWQAILGNFKSYVESLAS